VRSTTTIGRNVRVATGWPPRAGFATVVLMAALVIGCGATQPTQSSVAASSPPALTSTPPASHVPATSPSPAPEKAAIAAFVKLVTKSNFAYQATFKGLSRHTTARIPVTGAFAVSGRDYRLTAAFKFNDGTATVEHRYVDGKGWVRFIGQGWARLTNFTPAFSMSPFAHVKMVGDVRFVGTEKAGGKTVHRIQIDSVPFHPSLIPATNLSQETVTSGMLELLIDDAGRPISGSASVNGTGRVSGQLQEIVIELNLTFTKLGQKVTISAP
jgi:hypothetical protein